MNLKGAAFVDIVYEDCGCDPPISLISNDDGGVMDVSGCNFGTSNPPVVNSIAYWIPSLDAAADATAESKFSYGSNLNTGVVIINATNWDDNCEGGLLVDDMVEGSLKDCRALFEEEDPNSDGAVSSFVRGCAFTWPTLVSLYYILVVL